MDSLPLNPTDLAILVVLLLSAVFAFVRGFVHEMLAIGSWIGAALATLYGFPHAQPLARQHIGSPLLADMAAGMAIFLVVLVALSIATRLVCSRVRDSSLGPLDRSLGLLFGVARGGVLVSIAWLMLLWVMPREDHPDWITEARGLPLVEKGGTLIAGLIPDELGGRAARAAQMKAPAPGDPSDTERYQLLLSPSPSPSTSPKETGEGGVAPSDKPGYKGIERDAMQRLIETATQDSSSKEEVGR